MTIRTLLVVLAVPAAAADLPVREVTLYKHGVAYFQRSGDLKAGETVKLDFKAGDMNDVLKSLTLTDRGDFNRSIIAIPRHSRLVALRATVDLNNPQRAVMCASTGQ